MCISISLQSFFQWFIETEIILIDYEQLWCLRDLAFLLLLWQKQPLFSGLHVLCICWLRSLSPSPHALL